VRELLPPPRAAVLLRDPRFHGGKPFGEYFRI
jgi:hypothetical protein